MALLALGAAAPFAAIAAYLAIALITDDLREETERLEHSAQATTHRAERVVDSNRTILTELASRPDVRALNPAQCDPFLRDLMRLHPEFTNVFTLDAAGNRICSAAYRVAQQPAIDPANYLDQVKAHPVFTIGRPHKGRLSGKWIVQTVQPFLAPDGTLLGVAGIATHLTALGGLMQDASADREPVLLVVDSTGLVLAHHPDSDQWIGRDVSNSPITRLAVERRAGSARLAGVLGVERLWAFAPVRGTDWTVLSGTPMDIVMAPIYRTVTWIAALSVVGIAFVVALCIFLARPISRPVRAIAAAARRMSSHGSIEHLVPTGPDEIAALAEDLNRMLDARVAMESKLRERDVELSLIADNYPGWLMHLDREFRYLYANPGYLAIAGRSLHDLRGLHVREIVGDAKFDELQPGLARTLGGSTQSSEYKRTTIDGRTLSLFITSVPDLDSSGKVRGLFVFASDITQLRKTEGELNTERKRAHEEVRALNAGLERRVAERTAELEGANRELESFDYSISHDLRAPINRIRGFTDALLDGYAGGLEPQALEFLARIRASAVSMDQLVSDLLSLSTLSRGEVHRTSVDMSAIAGGVFENLQRTAPGRNVSMVIADGVRAEADPGLMHIVLENLLGNAWKFTSRRDDARIEFGADMDHGALRYFVRDNGAGFDQAIAGKKLFEPFRRMHSQSEFPGTGIGLATVERIVRRHGGRAHAEGAVGRGATIFFTLPPQVAA